MTKYKFSIVVSCYKVEKYIEQCIDSILSQDYDNFEVIIVDDGSPDKVGDIADQYAANDLRVKVVHKNNGGISSARNAGFKVISGNYVLFFDGDDFFASNKILTEINNKANEKESDVIEAGHVKYFEQSNKYGVNTLPTYCESDSVPDIIDYKLKKGMFSCSVCNKFYRVDFLHTNAIEFLPGMKVAEDAEWNFEVLEKANNISCIPIIVNVYRQRSDSVTHKTDVISLTTTLAFLDRWIERCNNDDISYSLRKSFKSILSHYLANALILFSSFEPQVQKKYRQRVKNLSWLFDYALDKRTKYIKISYKAVGLNITLFFLRLLTKLK